jgi:SnoaL-like protein
MAERCPEIEKFMLEVFEAFNRRDVGFLERTTSREPGTLDIGTDLDEWAEGYDAIIQLGLDMMREGPQQFDVGLDEVTAFSEGTFGWGAGRGYIGMQAKRVPLRFTVVVHQEDGDWKAIQSHVSIGVPNAEMLNPIFQPETATST